MALPSGSLTQSRQADTIPVAVSYNGAGNAAGAVDRGSLSVGNQDFNVKPAEPPQTYSRTSPTENSNRQTSPPKDATLKGSSVQRNEYSKIEWPIDKELTAFQYSTSVGVGAVIGWGASLGNPIGAAIGAGIGFLAALAIHKLCVRPSTLCKMADQAVSQLKSPGQFQQLGKAERAGQRLAFLHFREGLKCAAEEWISGQISLTGTKPSHAQVQNYLNHCAQRLKGEAMGLWDTLAQDGEYNADAIEQLKSVGSDNHRLNCAFDAVNDEFGLPQAPTQGEKRAARALAYVVRNEAERWAERQDPPPTKDQERGYIQQCASNLKNHGPGWSELSSREKFDPETMKRLESIARTGKDPVKVGKEILADFGRQLRRGIEESQSQSDSSSHPANANNGLESKHARIFSDPAQQHGTPADTADLDATRTQNAAATPPNLKSKVPPTVHQPPQVPDPPKAAAPQENQPPASEQRPLLMSDFVKGFHQENTDLNQLVADHLDRGQEIREAAQEEQIDLTAGSSDRKIVQQQTAELLKSNQLIPDTFRQQIADDNADILSHGRVTRKLDADAYQAPLEVIKGIARSRAIGRIFRTPESCNGAADRFRQRACNAAQTLEMHLLSKSTPPRHVVADICSLINHVQSYTVYKQRAENKPYTSEALQQSLEEILNDKRSQLDGKTLDGWKQHFFNSVAKPHHVANDSRDDVVGFYLTTPPAIGRHIIDMAKLLGQKTEQAGGDPTIYRLVERSMTAKAASLAGATATRMLADGDYQANPAQMFEPASLFIEMDLLRTNAWHAAYVHSQAGN